MHEGTAMHAMARELWPINRSLTGPGTCETLSLIQRELPDLRIHDIASGTQVFDWTVPDEWTIRSARLIGPDGTTVIDFADNNLHVVGYSEPVLRTLTLEELQPHLHSLPDQPDAIPYVTSYYKRRWGFCLTDRQRASLTDGDYRVEIDTTLASGVLNYGELLIPGESDAEIFLSTYVCHPSMANNELSGPMVTTWLAKHIAERSRRYSYRIVFIPETIGSLVYLSRHLDAMRAKIVAGFNITCIGDERAYGHVPSRAGDTLADRAAQHVLRHTDPDYRQYTYLDRGSDERQYCAPGVDLPVTTITRSKYHEYPEYHTSLDDLDFVTPAGLQGGYDALRRAIAIIEANRTYGMTVLGEPQLGKRGLYPDISTVHEVHPAKTLMDFLAYCDGTRDLIAIADMIGVPAWDLIPHAEKMAAHDLIEAVA
ncbi:MAG: DUF4910 domain-containing protein [Pontixanthobacter sp.]